MVQFTRISMNPWKVNNSQIDFSRGNSLEPQSSGYYVDGTQITVISKLVADMLIISIRRNCQVVTER